jgi:hypothetical protein
VSGVSLLDSATSSQESETLCLQINNAYIFSAEGGDVLAVLQDGQCDEVVD